MRNDFIDDRDKMNDILWLTRKQFLNSYSYLTEEDYNATLDKMWEELSDVPLDNTGEKIEDDFYIWKKGTLKEGIWHWFDERVQSGIGNRYFS